MNKPLNTLSLISGWFGIGGIMVWIIASMVVSSQANRLYPDYDMLAIAAASVTIAAAAVALGALALVGRLVAEAIIIGRDPVDPAAE